MLETFTQAVNELAGIVGYFVLAASLVYAAIKVANSLRGRGES